MKALTTSSRINSAVQVIQLMNTGMSIVEACKEIGIARSSYYYILDNNPEVLAEVQGLIDQSNREQLGLILLSKTEILRKLIEDGLSPDTKPKDRLAIYAKLNELEEQFTNSLQIENKIAVNASEFLRRGPKLAQGVSRVTATERMITIESEA